MKNILKYKIEILIYLVVFTLAALLLFNYETIGVKLGLINNELTTEEKEILSTEFLTSDYVASYSLEAAIEKEELFTLENSIYYVFFWKDGCSHCVDAESEMLEYIDLVEEGTNYTLYLYDANGITEDTDIQFAETQDIPEEITVEDFEVIGTPIMLKIDNTQGWDLYNQLSVSGTSEGYSLFVGADAILEELYSESSTK